MPETVRKIGKNAFYGCTSLSKVTLSNGLDSIMASAFSGCSALQSIALPNSVHFLGWNVFYGCSALTEVTLPNNIGELNKTFFGCSSLESVNLPATAVSLDGTFTGCSSLKSVIIPNSVSYIGENTFKDCSALTSVYLPNSVEFIGGYAFANTGLSSVSFPSTVTSIGQDAFYGCSQLASVIARPVTPPAMASQNTFIQWTYDNAKLIVPQVAVATYKSKNWWKLFKDISGNESLNDSYDFTSGGIYYIVVDDSNVEVTYKDASYNSYSGSITIPATVTNGGKTYHVTRIGYKAFWGSTGLTKVTFPSSLSTIAAKAFNGCTGLTSLTIPQSVTAIGAGAFEGCSGLTQLTWNARDCLSNGDMSTDNITKVTIGNSVETVPVGFVANSKITVVTIPGSVKNIGKNAFNECAALTSITIPKAVTSIGDNAFSGCIGLSSLTWNARECWFNGDMTTINISQVTIGNEVQVLPIGFVAKSKITSVAIPGSVKSIGGEAFFLCYGITDINLPEGLESIGEYAFYGLSSISSLSIPLTVESIGSYAFDECTGLTALVWNARNCSSNGTMSTQNIVQVTVGNEVRTLPRGFIMDSKVTSITLPSALKSIGAYTFYGCTGLTSVNIPNSVDSIGAYTFYGCTGLTSVNIPNSVTFIGYGAFYGCSSLTRVNISDLTAWCKITFEAWDGNPLSYANHLFLNGHEIKDLVIPNSVDSIGAYTFYGCTGLTSVKIPNSVTYIGYSAFELCTGLERVTIGESVEEIDSYAFYDCRSLEYLISLPFAPPSISYSTFEGLPSSMTVYVLPFALDAYQSDYYWSRYNIEVGRFDVANLTVNLLDGIDLANYADMKLEITRKDGDQTLHYIIGNRSSYTFANLDKNTVWDVMLTNQYGDEFGKIENVEIGEEAVSVTFVSLKQPQTVTLSVRTPAGQDVTELTRIAWLDENGELLKQGRQIAGLPSGRKLVYSVKLPQELAIAYSLPTDMTYTVKDGSNHVICLLAELAQAHLSGNVKEATSNQPLYGATISATQTFAGGNTKTTTATTDNQGAYTLDALSAPTTLTIAAPGYISQTMNCDELMTGGSNITLPDVALSPITGVVLNVNLTYTPAHAHGEQVETQNWYSDYSNVDYEVYNSSTGQTLTGVHVQYPQIVLTEGANDGDVLEITATSRTNAFKPVKTTVTVAGQSATATINILERGKIAAMFRNNINPSVVGTLYDSEDKLVRSDRYTGDALTIDDLDDGQYELVTMGQSEFFNSIYDLEQFAAAGLQEGEDYAKNAVSVANGLITPVTINEVPFLDETKFYYTGENTSFSVNKPNIVVGNYLTFRAQIDFKEQYANQVNDVKLIVDLPEGCPFYENSVMVGSNMGGYTIDGNRIIIPMTDYKAIVRFCAIPTVSGNYSPSAFVQFRLNGKTITQPIGNAPFTAKGLSLSLVSTTNKTNIPIGGTAIGICDITIYDNDVLIGHTTSLQNGTWSTQCELYNPYNLSTHRIYAKVTTVQGYVVQTEVAECFYDQNAIEVDNVVMLYDNPEKGLYNIVFDFINGTVSPSSYYFFPYKSWPNWYGSGTEPKLFTFVVNFTNNNPSIVSDVVVNVFSDHNFVCRLPAVYDTNKDQWVTSAYFQEYNAPVNVSVSYFVNTIRMPDAELINDNISLSVISQMQDDIEKDVNDGVSLLDQLLELYVADDYDEARITELENEVCEYFGLTEIAPVPISNQEEGQQLIDEITQVLSNPVFSVADNFINSNLSDILSGSDSEHGIIYGDCKDYDEATMTDYGYEQVMLTDSSVVYYKQTETEFIFVSFSNNISAIIPLERLFDTSLNIPLRNAFIENAQIFIETASENLTKVTDGLNSIKDIIDTFSNAVSYAYGKAKDSFSNALGALKKMAAERRAGNAFPGQRIIEGGIKDQAKASGKVMLGAQRMGNSVSKTMNSPIGKAFQKVLAAFDLISQITQGIDDVRTAIGIWNAVPTPCEEDQVEADNIRGRTEYIGGAAIAFYALNITSSVLAIQAAVGSAAALVPTAGVSLTTLLVDLGIIIAKGLACDAYHSEFERDANDLQSRIGQLKCKKEEDDEEDIPAPPCPPVTPTHDPSGFVYEGVPSNRLQGVTATCYYKETEEDMYGDPVENVVLWDAENYGQENPLITDENGYYRWDVPIGMWQVKYEKEGYETTYSDWLPVPPPQLDVNIGMVQMRQPEVIKARAYPAAVEFEFDKFMFPEDLTLDNIKVTDEWGYDLYGEIELLNAEVDDPNAITSIRRAPGTGLTLASKVRFNAYDYFYSDEVTLKVSKRVKSYAGLEMAENYVVTLPIEYEMEKIDVDTTLTMPYGDSRQLTVTVLPARASKGKTLSVRTMSPMILSTDAETYTLDNNGQAIITVHGDLPGAGSLLYSIEDYDLTASTLVKVMMESQMTVATPTASIASGSEVEKGTAVYLRCATEGATIYYTLDGSCPCDNTAARKVYDGSPIIINSTVTIKAMATAPDLYDSDVITFVYRVAGGKKGDVNGDGEVNIADVNAVIDIILGGQADADTRYRADVNGDGEVNIADINAVIDIILNPAANMMLKVNCDDLLHMDDVTMKPGDVRTLQVTVDHAAHYSALQCDIVLPAGLTLMDVYAPGANTVRTGGVNDNTCRALNYSMARLPFVGDTQPVMTFTVRADAALAPESEISLINVVLADAGNKAWRVSDCTARVNNASGINDMTAAVDRVWVEGRTLFIEARQDGTAQLAMINGMVSNIPLKAGINRQRLDRGIYIVVVNGQSHKIAIK